MYINKNFPIKGVFRFAGHHLLWLTIWMSIPPVLFYFMEEKWIFIPWLPVSLVGTAVAFYVGFKNNQSYDRLWEARKIWGAIVNSSRSFGIGAKSLLTKDFGTELTEEELKQHTDRLVNRHIAWLYQLRKQLLVPTPWEHGGLKNKFMQRFFLRRQREYGLGLVEDQEIENIMKGCMSDLSVGRVKDASNSATAILDVQADHLKKLRALNAIDDYKQIAMFDMLKEFYEHQGKCERIKKFPLPRQYASMSNIFTGIFIFLLPFGTIDAFHQIGSWGVWVSILANVIVGWVYIVMELIGDYSENPFEGLGNDIPMLSLCRTIEIDLREMIGEKDIPKPIEAVQGVLM